MRGTLALSCACLLALGALLAIDAGASAQAAEPEFKLPAAAEGFAGKIQGKIVSKNDKDSTLVFRIEKVISVDTGNRAKKPDALKGLKVEIYPRVIFKDSKLRPDDALLEFIRNVQAGSKFTLDVKSDLTNRLRLQEVPKIGMA